MGQSKFTASFDVNYDPYIILYSIFYGRNLPARYYVHIFHTHKQHVDVSCSKQWNYTVKQAYDILELLKTRVTAHIKWNINAQKHKQPELNAH